MLVKQPIYHKISLRSLKHNPSLRLIPLNSIHLVNRIYLWSGQHVREFYLLFQRPCLVPLSDHHELPRIVHSNQFLPYPSYGIISMTACDRLAKTTFMWLLVSLFFYVCQFCNASNKYCPSGVCQPFIRQHNSFHRLFVCEDCWYSTYYVSTWNCRDKNNDVNPPRKANWSFSELMTIRNNFFNPFSFSHFYPIKYFEFVDQRCWMNHSRSFIKTLYVNFSQLFSRSKKLLISLWTGVD